MFAIPYRCILPWARWIQFTTSYVLLILYFLSRSSRPMATFHQRFSKNFVCNSHFKHVRCMTGNYKLWSSLSGNFLSCYFRPSVNNKYSNRLTGLLRLKPDKFPPLRVHNKCRIILTAQKHLRIHGFCLASWPLITNNSSFLNLMLNNLSLSYKSSKTTLIICTSFPLP